MRPVLKHCKSCGAPIYWAESSSGTPIPIDAEPTERGNITLTVNSIGRLRAKVWWVTHEIPAKFDGKRRESHFVTCPEADRWRK